MRNNVMAVYPRAALSVLRRGRAEAATASLPQAGLTVTDLAVDPDNYADYCRLTGFRVSGDLPITYPHLLGFDSVMRLFTHRDFPFSPVGMVHIRNRIVQHRSIAVDDRLTVRVRLADLTPHPKGAVFNAVTEVDHDDAPVWSESSTYLVRTRHPDPTAVAEPRGELDLDLDDLEALWRFRGDTGRRYAAVSGDYNPIHLHAITARMFGQRRAIAHGMWTLARCLGAMENRLAPPPRVVEAHFRRPLPLPASSVALCTDRAHRTWHFGLFDPRTEKPYLNGTVAPA